MKQTISGDIGENSYVLTITNIKKLPELLAKIKIDLAGLYVTPKHMLESDEGVMVQTELFEGGKDEV